MTGIITDKLDNETRAMRAENVLERYKYNELGEDGEVCEDDITDLFTDLRHWIDQNMPDIDLDELFAMSEVHFNTEKEEQEGRI